MKRVRIFLALLLGTNCGLWAADRSLEIRSSLVAATATPESAQAPDSTMSAVLKPITSFALAKEVTGPFDHFGIDVVGHRLFATAEDYHAVLVLDLETGKTIHEIKDIAKPHAILYRGDLDRIYVTDGVDGSLKIFDGKTYRLSQRIELEKDTDSIGFDPVSNLLYVVSGGKDAGQTSSLLSAIDTNTGKKTAELKIEGETLEAMALDTFRPKLYLNNAAKSRIEVINRWKGTLVAEWPVTMGKRNVAMALDEPHQRLFAACRSGQIVVFDSNTGRELQAVPIAEGVDDLVYDATSRRLYAAGGGFVEVIEQKDADHYNSLGRISTGTLARTALLVPQINRYFVAIPQSKDTAASIAVFEPQGIPATKPAPVLDSQSITAPFAERLVLDMLSDHPDLRKMGLHAVPPGKADSVIVANGNASRIGVKSTSGDLDAVKDGKTYCASKENGSFYNLKLPLFDAAGRRIGILVMEMPYTSATDENEAIRKAESIRSDLAQKIPDLNRLFGD
jgi:DNA-binding beta-propeller fold protein YncE